MLNEGAPEYLVDQGMYYPTATNYGYVCTGFESPGDWDDHRRVFGPDGHEIQYAGVQTESLPYVYYTPTYEYAQSPYNPYNPFIPGAVLGADGSLMGSQVAQQYYTVPSYENPASGPTYFPMVVQPGPEIISSSTTESLFSAGSFIANRADGVGFEHPNPNAGPSAISATLGNTAHSVISGSLPSQVFQGRSTHVADSFAHGNGSFHRNQVKAGISSSNDLSKFGPSAAVEKTHPKFQHGRHPNDVNGSSDTISETYRGPKTNKSNNYLTVKAYTTRAGETDAQGNIVICRDHYNNDSFSVDYKNAKFFVIKSYSEDDVHKGVKYNVWSSTTNGNKKLQMAYEDAQRLSAGEPGGCPIFLFFSVNASGQFCGVAEMIGPVDFYKDMDFWQQDKWGGCFPVKWHFVKDVPNINLRHIILEYNENKPVTNSRDAQEIRYKQGIEMLKIFKNYASKTSLLDDFMYYENRQKIMQEEKARLLIRNYGTSFIIPALDPPRKQSCLVDMSSSKERNAAMKPKEVNCSEKFADSVSVDADKLKEDGVSSLKIGSLSINPKQPDPRPLLGSSNLEEASSKSFDVVTVGSMPIKVNGYGKSSGILTVGTIPLDPRALQPNDDGGTKSGSQH